MLYTTDTTNTHTNRHAFIFYSYTHQSYKRQAEKDVNSKESSLAYGCRLLRLLHHTHPRHMHTAHLGGYVNPRQLTQQNKKLSAFKNTHTNASTHLLYNGGELQAELNDIISGNRVVCHSSKGRPGRKR